MADVLHSPAVNLSRKSEKSYDITILVSSGRRDPHLCPVGRGKPSRPHKFADVIGSYDALLRAA